MKLHEKIRQYIENNKLTIKEVGEQTDIELKRFYRIIAGDSKMTADEFEKICKVLKVSPNYFFDNKILRSEEHTSELQSRGHLVCRLLLESIYCFFNYFL